MTIIIEGMKVALIIERNAIIMMAGDATTAVAGIDSPLSSCLQPGVPVRQDREIGKGIARYSDMHQQGEGDAILLQCPHLLTNDARWLTLLRTRRIGTTKSLRVQSRQKALLLLPPLLVRTKRWVVIHRSVQNTPRVFPYYHQTRKTFHIFAADRSLVQQDHSPALTATELRERLLREKVKALRKSSSARKSPPADADSNHVPEKV